MSFYRLLHRRSRRMSRTGASLAMGPNRARLVCFCLPLVGLGAAVGAGSAAALPEGRHYEQVSPAEKGDGDIIAEGLKIKASNDGDAAAFESRLVFGDAIGSGMVGRTTYVARRGGGKWSTRSVTPMPRPDAIQVLPVQPPSWRSSRRTSAMRSCGRMTCLRSPTTRRCEAPLHRGHRDWCAADGQQDAAGPAHALRLPQRPVLRGFRRREARGVHPASGTRLLPEAPHGALLQVGRRGLERRRAPAGWRGSAGGRDAVPGSTSRARCRRTAAALCSPRRLMGALRRSCICTSTARNRCGSQSPSAATTTRPLRAGCCSRA